MKKTKASERIQLSSGQVMTLGEALDAGILTLKASIKHSRTKEDSQGRALAIAVYDAWDEANGVGWEIGETLYQSRMGLPVSVAQ